MNHVQLVHELGNWAPGAQLGHGAADDEIARWCHAEAHVLVTTDDDFRAMHTRAGVHLDHGAEVIFCTPQPATLSGQVELVVLRNPSWIRELEKHDQGPRLWIQRPRSFKLEVGGPGRSRRQDPDGQRPPLS